MTHAGPDLDRIIQEMLLLESSKYPEDVSWLEENFYHSPMIAAMISLSNLQFKLNFLEGELLKEII